MGIVAVDAPGSKYALGIPILSWATDMIHHLVSPARLDRRANPLAISFNASSHETCAQRPSPRLPTRFRGKNPIRIVDLVMVAGPLAQLRPRDAGCCGLPSNLRTVKFVFAIYIGQQTTGRFAIEAGGWH